MNARAGVVDAWRKIKVAQNSLESDLDVVVGADVATDEGPGERLADADALGVVQALADERRVDRECTGLVEPGDPVASGSLQFLLERLYWVRFSLMRAALPRRLRR